MLYGKTLWFQFIGCKAPTLQADRCGEAAHLPFRRNGKNKTAGFVGTPSDLRMKLTPKPPDLPPLMIYRVPDTDKLSLRKQAVLRCKAPRDLNYELRITNYELKSPAGALHLLLYRSSSLKCLCQRHLVCIFQLRTDRYTVGKTAYRDAHRL